MKKISILYLLICVVLAFFLIDFCLDKVMMKGVNNYYGLNQDSQILLIGHSHLMLATDKEKLEKGTGLKVSKYCREGVNVVDRETMIRHFLNNGHADSLKTVLYGVDLYTFTGSGLSKNSYQLFYPFIDNEEVADYLKKEASPTDYWLHKLVRTTRFNNDGLKNSVWRGLSNNWDNLKTNTINAEKYASNVAKNGIQTIEMNDTLISVFSRTIKNLTQKGIRVVLVNTPTIDILNESQGKRFREITDWYRNIADKDSLVEYWDFNPEFSSDHTLFSDPIHLNVKGQEVITKELIDRLKGRRQ